MKRKTAGILVLSGAALYHFVLRGVRAIQVAFDKFRLISAGNDTLRFGVDVRIKNPLWVGVLVKDLVGEIYIMDVPVATVDYPINQRIYKRSISNISINFEASMSQLGEALYRNIETGNVQTLMVRFVGYVESDKLRIPIDKTFTYDDLFGV